MIKEKQIKEVELSNPVLVFGMGGGMGLIAKVAGDYLIDKLQMEKFYEIWGSFFPHEVYVDDKGIVNLLKAEFYYKKFEDHELIVLTGETQPVDINGQYLFAEKVMELCKKWGVKKIITLGGYDIGHEPEDPKVYVAASCEEILNEFIQKYPDLKKDFYGNIVGLAGLLIGFAREYGIPAIVLLAETWGHPMFVGLRGARSVLRVLNAVFGWNIDLTDLEKEIEEREKAEKAAEERLRKRLLKKEKEKKDITYIG